MADLIFFKDLALDITVNSQGDISDVVNAESIKQGLRMMIDTARGSRIFLPDYGCRVRAFLFEPFDEDTARRIGEELQNTIKNYEKRIQLLNLQVQMDFNDNSYEINVIYKIIATNQIENLDVTLERL
jgi:phage baseplate assembly protein W